MSLPRLKLSAHSLIFVSAYSILTGYAAPASTASDSVYEMGGKGKHRITISALSGGKKQVEICAYDDVDGGTLTTQIADSDNDAVIKRGVSEIRMSIKPTTVVVVEDGVVKDDLGHAVQADGTYRLRKAKN